MSSDAMAGERRLMNPLLSMSSSWTLPPPVPPRPPLGDALIAIKLWTHYTSIIQYISQRDMSKGWLSTRQAAKRLGVSEASVRRWSDRGLLPVQRVGKRLERRRQPGDAPPISRPRPAGPPPASPP